MGVQTKDIIEHEYTVPSGRYYVRFRKKEDFDWLIERANRLRKIADTWIAIEENGTSEDAADFYTVVQNILSGDLYD